MRLKMRKSGKKKTKQMNIRKRCFDVCKLVSPIIKKKRKKERYKFCLFCFGLVYLGLMAYQSL